MSGNAVQLLNSELTESAREHRERELLKRIDARDREAMREFYLYSSTLIAEAPGGAADPRIERRSAKGRNRGAGGWTG